MGSSSSKPTTPIEISNKVACKGIPRCFDLLAGDSWSHPIFYIAAPGLPPHYALSMPEGWGGCTILHSQPSIKGSPTVYVKNRHGKFRFYLPGVLSAGIMPCQATMRYEANLTEKYCFELMVYHDNSYRTERFEWRYFRKEDIKRPGAASSGWKLVRLGPKVARDVLPPYPGRTSNQHEHVEPPAYSKEAPSRRGVKARTDTKSEPSSTSQGEVVAVFAQSSIRGTPKAWRFQYLGTGATEEIGYHWTLMAAISGVCLWQHQVAKAHYGAT